MNANTEINPALKRRLYAGILNAMNEPKTINAKPFISATMDDKGRISVNVESYAPFEATNSAPGCPQSDFDGSGRPMMPNPPQTALEVSHNATIGSLVFGPRHRPEGDIPMHSMYSKLSSRLEYKDHLIRQACEYLRENAPAKALEVLERALGL